MLVLKHYQFIDALRGLAVLAVLLTHSANAAMPKNSFLISLFQLSANGVQLFYIVSSIAICMSWDRRSNIENFSKFDFYIRRFFRIAPMFYFSIILYLLIYGLSPRYWAPSGIDPWFILATVFLLHGFHPETINSVVPGGWSIAVEVTFYVIFPFAINFLKSYKILIIALIVSILFFNRSNYIYQEIFQYSQIQNYLIESFSLLNFFGQLPIFIIGIISYFYINKPFSKSMTYFLIASFVTFIFFEKYAFDFVKLFVPRHIIIGFLFALLAIYLSTNPIKIIVNNVTIRFGKLSYSMYLLHHVALYFFEESGLTYYLSDSNIGSILHFLLLVLVTAILAFITFNLIEKPGINIGLWFKKFTSF